MEMLTPRQIVAELDKYIIGQDKAKRAVAVALRNRYRRSKLPAELAEDVTPKNIILKGPTGVGKTELARRIAKLVKAPFVKVEATKYTEVGYVGRDVESMIRDLVETSIRLVKDEKFEKVKAQAENVANTKIRDIIYAKAKMTKSEEPENYRDVLLQEIADHKHDDEIIEMEVVDAPKAIEIIPGNQDSGITEMLSGFMPKRKRIRKISVKQARNIIVDEESSKLIDMDAVQEEGMRRAEQEGIIFIDEIDKIAMSRGNNSGADVSREGVQRDILPFVEGCTVSTKYGIIKTDYILFIAAGAFHVSNIEDLIPELQGRFPVRVELDNLTSKEFYKILSQPKNAITKQQIELLKVDNINLSFDDEALQQIADIAEMENESNENIGARRLYTIMEALLEEVSFDAGESHPMVDVKVTKQFVLKVLGNTIKNYDMSKYIM